MNVVNLNERFNSFVRNLSDSRNELRKALNQLDSFEREHLLEQSLNEALQMQRKFATWMMDNNHDIEATNYFVMTMWQLSDRLLNLGKSKEVNTSSLFDTTKLRNSEIEGLLEYFLFFYSIIQLSPASVKSARLFNTQAIKYMTLIHSSTSAKV